MIQLALRSSIQAELAGRVDEAGQDRRQGDRRDHQLQAGQEHAGRRTRPAARWPFGDPRAECRRTDEPATVAPDP